MESPAHSGEIVTLIGTGFGPYQVPATEGLALPPGPGFRVEAEVSLQLGDLRPDIIFTGGVTGQIGLDQVRFRVPDTLPEGGGNVFRIKVRMDERDSNEVVLPVAR